MTTLTPTLPQAPTTSVLGQKSATLQIDSTSASPDVIAAQAHREP